MFYNCEYGFFDIYRLLFSLAGGVLLLHLCFYCSLSFILSHFLLAYSVNIVCTFRYSLSDSSRAFANDFMCVLMASVVFSFDDCIFVIVM